MVRVKLTATAAEMFNNLHPDTVAYGIIPVLECFDAADIKAYRSVEFESVAARGGFGRTEHHTDLHAYLVDENDRGIGF